MTIFSTQRNGMVLAKTVGSVCALSPSGQVIQETRLAPSLKEKETLLTRHIFRVGIRRRGYVCNENLYFLFVLRATPQIGQYVGSVDDDSPASHAGMKAGDRIVEVNGTNISNENHQQVVQRIKAVPNEAKLLLVDKETDEFYHSQKLVIRGDLPNVHRIEGPASREAAGQVNHRDSASASEHSSGGFPSASASLVLASVENVCCRAV